MKRSTLLSLSMAVAVSFQACHFEDTGRSKSGKREVELNNSAVQALSDGRLDQALTLVDEAITLQPNFHEAYANKAAILRAMGRTDAACLALKKAIALEPKYADAYIPLGVLLEKDRKEREAAVQYRKAVELYGERLKEVPADSDAAVNLAIAHFLLRGNDAALAVLNNLLTRDPRNVQARAVKAQIESGDRETFLNSQPRHPRTNSSTMVK